MKAEQELGIGSKAQESGSFSDAFILFKLEIGQNVSSFCFCFGTWWKEAGDVW